VRGVSGWTCMSYYSKFTGLERGSQHRPSKLAFFWSDGRIKAVESKSIMASISITVKWALQSANLHQNLLLTAVVYINSIIIYFSIVLSNLLIPAAFEILFMTKCTKIHFVKFGVDFEIIASMAWRDMAIVSEYTCILTDRRMSWLGLLFFLLVRDF